MVIEEQCALLVAVLSALSVEKKQAVRQDGILLPFALWDFGRNSESLGEIIIVAGMKTSNPPGMLRKWQLRLFGSPMTPEEFQFRKR